jgi:hypothetical protein
MSRRKRLTVAVVLAGGVFGLLTLAVLAGPSTIATVRIGNDAAGRIGPRVVRHRPQTTHDLCALHRDLP